MLDKINIIVYNDNRLRKGGGKNENNKWKVSDDWEQKSKKRDQIEQKK